MKCNVKGGVKKTRKVLYVYINAVHWRLVEFPVTLQTIGISPVRMRHEL